MSFEAWLAERYAPSTAAAYARYAALFNAEIGASHARYADVADWIGRVRRRTPNAATVRPHLFALRAFFTWQIDCGLRTDNPARAFVLAGHPPRATALPHLLTPQEVRVLRDRSSELPLREAIILGFLSWSALTSREVTELTTQDLDPARWTLHVPSCGRIQERIILLPKQQIMCLTDYLENERPALMGKTDLPHLVLTRRGNAETPDGVQRVVQKARFLTPGRRLTPTLIRQSVIAMMLGAGHNLRAVQLFAGHRLPGTTERYRFTNLAELSAAVGKFHPMD